VEKVWRILPVDARAPSAQWAEGEASGESVEDFTCRCTCAQCAVGTLASATFTATPSTNMVPWDHTSPTLLRRRISQPSPSVTLHSARE
jgi:hypothetical protein